MEFTYMGENWDRYLAWCAKNGTQPDVSDYQRYLDEQ
jgi:hypothetical protein